MHGSSWGRCPCGHGCISIDDNFSSALDTVVVEGKDQTYEVSAPAAHLSPAGDPIGVDNDLLLGVAWHATITAHQNPDGGVGRPAVGRKRDLANDAAILNQLEMIHGIFGMSARPVREVMVPRIDVVSLPRKRNGSDNEESYVAIDAVAKPGTDVNRGMRAIKDADPSFDPKGFVEGAKMAYEMIVMAYADGDRKALKNLLSREVYDGSVAAIADREARSEKIQSSFVGIDKIEIVAAEMKGSEAHVTLRIVSELISGRREGSRK